MLNGGYSSPLFVFTSRVLKQISFVFHDLFDYLASANQMRHGTQSNNQKKIKERIIRLKGDNCQLSGID
jgi:hypothetical protein